MDRLDVGAGVFGAGASVTESRHSGRPPIPLTPRHFPSDSAGGRLERVAATPLRRPSNLVMVP